MAQGADTAVSLQVLREDHQLQELVPAKVLASAPVKDAKLDEALAKECQATLSYAEHTLVALVRTLPREAMREAQETLFLSLQRSLAHSAALLSSGPCDVWDLVRTNPQEEAAPPVSGVPA
jgi:hypothetical protein